MIRNLTRQTILTRHEIHARGFFQRARGMIGRTFSATFDGMFFPNCKAIHMLGMTRKLDVIFINADATVVHLAENLAPGRFAGPVRNAESVLELPPGRIGQTRTQCGDQLEINHQTLNECASTALPPQENTVCISESLSEISPSSPSHTVKS